MNKRHTALAALAITASVALLAGCSSSGGSSSGGNFSKDAKGSLNAWGFDNADEVGTSRIDYAKSQLKDVTIKIDQTPFDAQKFTTRVAGGNVPDVVQMDRQFVATYAAQGLIQPLDQCYSVHNVDPQKQYYGSVMDDITYKSKIYAVPQFYQPPAIITNERVMKAAGVTDADIDTSKPEQLVAAVKKMYKGLGRQPVRARLRPAGQRPGGPVAARQRRPGHRLRRQADPRRPQEREGSGDPEADRGRPGRLREDEELHRLLRLLRREQPVREGPGRR
ncbi:ABC transporter substrate-binding protein [Leifsonia sp. L25]|uniref:ABC transporter substrate-binding protein n=1 Tax=Leifsonia sp. L25 TaxID=3423957 RepID=UPI003D68B732